MVFWYIPKKEKKEEIFLDDKIIEEMENILEGIIGISILERPPKAEYKSYCKRCSFYELCMV